MLQYLVSVPSTVAPGIFFFLVTMKDWMGDGFLCFFATVTSIFAKNVF
jgi:hypothetical protein